MKAVLTLADLEKMKLAEKSREHFCRGAHLIGNCDGGCRHR